MKNLVIIRHGKSSWNHNISDVLRPLTARGKNDIKLIGDFFNSLNLTPDAIFPVPQNGLMILPSFSTLGLKIFKIQL